MHSTDFCFPLPFDYEHSRHIRSQHLFEACASPLRPRLAPWMMEAGGPGGSRRPIRFGGLLRVSARRFLPSTPRATVPLTSLSLSRGSHLACARLEVRRVSRDRDMHAFREEPPATTIQDAFHRQRPAPCAGSHPLSKAVT
jgi:hypothetical protein